MCVIWGIPYLMIRVAVRELAPVTLVFLRTGLAALLLVPLAAQRRELRPLLAHWRPLLAYTGIEVALPWLLLSRAETKLTSSLTGLLIAAVPLVGALIVSLSGERERLGGRRWVGLLVGVGGVAAIVGLDLGHIDAVALVEIALVAVCYALGPVILARDLNGAPPLGVVAASLALSAVAYAPLAAARWPGRMPSAHVVESVVGLAVVCSAAAFLIFFALIAEVGPVRATVITYVNPAVAAVVGVLLLNERLTAGMGLGFALVSVHVGLNSLSLLRYASEEQKQRWLVPQASGEKIACFGLTEPAAGSDVASMKTTARHEGDAYVLNGQKNWISYATVSDHALVFAKTDPAARHKGISAFMVEKGTKGFTSAETEHKLGIWAGSTGELFFENVELPAENLIGEEGQGFEIAMYGLDQGRFTVAAGACGVIRACLERSVEYARERETFGQPIGKYQFVQDMIAEMVLGYETSKLLVMQAAWLKNEGHRNTRETSLAKWHATESAFRAAHLAIQVHGAYGYSAEYGIERYFRNARAPIIYEGTTQVHKLMQAEHALGYRSLNGRDGDVSPLCAWAPALAPVQRERGPVATGA